MLWLGFYIEFQLLMEFGGQAGCTKSTSKKYMKSTCTHTCMPGTGTLQCTWARSQRGKPMFSLFSHQLVIHTSMSKCCMKKHSLSFKPLQQMLDSKRSSQHIVSAGEGLNTISCTPLSVITMVHWWGGWDISADANQITDVRPTPWCDILLIHYKPMRGATALDPLQKDRNKSFMGKHQLMQSATLGDIRMLGTILLNTIQANQAQATVAPLEVAPALSMPSNHALTTLQAPHNNTHSLSTRTLPPGLPYQWRTPYECKSSRAASKTSSLGICHS